MNQEYETNGYFVIRRLFGKDDLKALTKVVLQFHDSWKRSDEAFYLEKAVNSAYITGTQHLNDSERNVLFKFIGSSKLMEVVSSVIADGAAFMNTQLFFNPLNPAQKNYWHRDSQYHLSINEQRAALAGPKVIHVRIPLFDEPGIELVPGTHKRWDTDEELDVRLENNGRRNYEDISSGLGIKLAAGDLMVFSANMIHRGLYGMDRLSLDVLFCDSHPSLLAFVNDDCLPGQAALDSMENPSAFLNTLKFKT